MGRVIRLSQYIMENRIHVWNHKPDDDDDDDDDDEDVGAHVLGETNPNHQPVMQKTWQSVWIPQLDRWTHPHFPTQEIDCRRPHGETWFEPTEFCHGTEHQSYPKAPVPGGFLGKRSSKLVTSPKKT